MTEELEQLLKNLKLRRMLDVYDEQLRAAEKAQTSYSEFVAGLLRAQWHDRQRCQFIRAQDLFDEMYASLADRSTRQLLNRLARLDVLLIDEFGYLNLKPEQSNTFFKLMEERYTRHSTILTTNLGYDEWQNFLGNKSMVDALLSRVRHYCHTVTINGPSLREPQG
jgi:DNA replication protein DnaC